MSPRKSGFTVGQLMVAVLAGALTVALCLAVDGAVRRHRATDFPPGPLPVITIHDRQGYGDK
ncbi:MAG TPA: hypothetical protein VGH33_13495 [Isosphaeraceae bacterium]